MYNAQMESFLIDFLRVDGTKQFAIYDIATRTIGDSTCNQFPAHWTIET